MSSLQLVCDEKATQAETGTIDSGFDSAQIQTGEGGGGGGDDVHNHDSNQWINISPGSMTRSMTPSMTHSPAPSMATSAAVSPATTKTLSAHWEYMSSPSQPRGVPINPESPMSPWTTVSEAMRALQKPLQTPVRKRRPVDSELDESPPGAPQKSKQRLSPFPHSPSDGEVGTPDKVCPMIMSFPVPDELLLDQHEPSEDAKQNAPEGWLIEWDFMTEEQRQSVINHPDGIFPCVVSDAKQSSGP